MRSPLEVYLRNHEAAAEAGRDLFRRAAHNQRRSPQGPALADLRDDVARDLELLRELMEHLGIQPDPVLGLALRLGERVGRLKPNGGLLLRQPLSDLIEVEACTDAVHAKLAGWRALTAATVVADHGRLAELLERAEDQAERLWGLHATVSRVLQQQK